MQFRNLAFMAVGALTLAGCATSSPDHGYGGSRSGGGYSQAPQSRYCADCGIVTRIESVASNRAAPTGTGAVLGGIVGAVLSVPIAAVAWAIVKVWNRPDDGSFEPPRRVARSAARPVTAASPANPPPTTTTRGDPLRYLDFAIGPASSTTLIVQAAVCPVSSSLNDWEVRT